LRKRGNFSWGLKEEEGGEIQIIGRKWKKKNASVGKTGETVNFEKKLKRGVNSATTTEGKKRVDQNMQSEGKTGAARKDSKSKRPDGPTKKKSFQGKKKVWVEGHTKFYHSFRREGVWTHGGKNKK